MVGRVKRPAVRVLLYHAIGGAGRGPIHRCRVPADRFEAQVGLLARDGYSVVGLETVLAGLQDENAWPDRAVAITFDDGYRSVFNHALPVLKRFGFRATVYVVPGYCLEGGTTSGDIMRDEELLGPDELATLASEGWTVGSHSMTHRRLSSCKPEEVMHELVESQQRLTDLLGKPVDHFSFPHGDWTAELVTQVKRAGYRSGATSREGTNRVGNSPWLLRRIEITPWDSLRVFRWKLEGSYDWLGSLRRG